jgi:hypothetical protein
MYNGRRWVDAWGECFVSLTFTVAVFWREILTVDVKVKKVILKSFMYCMKLGFFRLILGLPLPFIWRFVGFLFLGCLLEPRPFQRLGRGKP